ncbi:MAG TPA: arsenate reductase ArsC [Anaerohalosphaeraceae bacterium]|nr:arsenate reductase ArsC [Anaerohalosphaeraceae bacterium]
MKKERVLFFCKHNSCRSQMAEAYLKKLAADRFEVFSAGLFPEMIHPLVEVVMLEDGVSIRGQTAKSIDLYLGKQPLDHIIIVCQEGEAECPRLYPFALHVERWPLPDPASVQGDRETILAAFRQTRDAVKERVKDWLKKKTEPQGK